MTDTAEKERMRKIKNIRGIGLLAGTDYPNIEEVPAEPCKDVFWREEVANSFEVANNGYSFYRIENEIVIESRTGSWYRLNNETKCFEFLFEGFKDSTDYTRVSLPPQPPTFVGSNSFHQAVFPMNEDGKPILLKEDKGKTIFPFYEGYHLFPVDDSGAVCVPLGDDGKPVFPRIVEEWKGAYVPCDVGHEDSKQSVSKRGFQIHKLPLLVFVKIFRDIQFFDQINFAMTSRRSFLLSQIMRSKQYDLAIVDCFEYIQIDLNDAEIVLKIFNSVEGQVPKIILVTSSNAQEPTHFYPLPDFLNHFLMKMGVKKVHMHLYRNAELIDFKVIKSLMAGRVASVSADYECVPREFILSSVLESIEEKKFDGYKTKAELIRKEAKKFFKEDCYGVASDLYSVAIKLHPSAILYGNRAQAYLKKELYGAALDDAEKAIAIDPSYVKGFYRRATANMALGRFRKALADLKAVVKAAPRDRDAREKCNECQRIVRRQAFLAAISDDDSNTTDTETLDISKIAVKDI